MLSRFITAAFNGTTSDRNTIISSNAESEHDDADEQRQLCGEGVCDVHQRPPSFRPRDLHASRPLYRRDRVFAQMRDESLVAAACGDERG